MLSRMQNLGWALVVHTCNISWSGRRDQEDRSSKLAWENSSCDPISKTSITKNWVDGVSQGDSPEFKPQYCKKEKECTVQDFQFPFWSREYTIACLLHFLLLLVTFTCNRQLFCIPHVKNAFLLLLFILWYRGMNSGPSPWAIPPVLFLWKFFQDRVSWTICPGLTLNCNPPDLCLLSS
jgi:hypothetical protein